MKRACKLTLSNAFDKSIAQRFTVYTTILDRTLNYTSYRVYGMITSEAFFETKLSIRSFQHIAKFIKQTILKNFT